MPQQNPTRIEGTGRTVSPDKAWLSYVWKIPDHRVFCYFLTVVLALRVSFRVSPPLSERLEQAIVMETF